MTTETGSAIREMEVSLISTMQRKPSVFPMAVSTRDMTERVNTLRIESMASGVIILVLYYALYSSSEAGNIPMFSVFIYFLYVP